MPGPRARARSATRASSRAWRPASRVVAIAPAPGRRGDEAVGEVRRERRERPAHRRDRLGAGGGGLVRREDAGGRGAGEDAVAGGARGLGRAVGPAGLGRLRQGDEQRGLGGGQPARLLAEPGEAGGADALEVAAVGREGEVEREDRVLVEPALEGEGDADLAELAGERAGRALLEQAGDLHRERRAAGDDPARGERPGAAARSERERVDAADGSGSGGPRRREAARDSRGRRRRGRRPGASARRRRCRRRAARRRGRARRRRSRGRAAAGPSRRSSGPRRRRRRRQGQSPSPATARPSARLIRGR